MNNKAQTITEYLKEFPAETRKELSAVRKVVLANLPKGYKEGMLYGMICYFVPLEDYADTYNGMPLMLGGIAGRKNYNSLYLNTVYGNPETDKWFKARYKVSGKRLDMGKSCVHFKRAEDLPLDLIAETIGRVSKDAYIKYFEDVKGSSRKKRR